MVKPHPRMRFSPAPTTTANTPVVTAFGFGTQRNICSETMIVNKDCDLLLLNTHLLLFGSILHLAAVRAKPIDGAKAQHQQKTK